jgi:spoIIIJ-associated protein
MGQRFEGRNLEEALQLAGQTFAVERWQLTWHVMEEKRGFLGGMKHVVIEADVNQDAAPAPAQAAPESAAPRERAPQRDRAASAPREAGAREGHRGRSRGRSRGASPEGAARGGNRGGSRGRSGGRGGYDSRDLQVGDFEQFIGDVPEQGSESEAAASARQWCEKTLALAKIQSVVRSEENETQIILRLFGADSVLLLERNGELLDAIQVLANKTLVGRATEKDIELDCQQFKQKRIDDLEQRARACADRVRESGVEEVLPAMTPIERRIVHIALRDDADVTTESRGEGFFKRVAIVERTEENTPGTTATPEP